MLKLAAAAAVRRGTSDRDEIGQAASSDVVAGLETQRVGGQLVERAHAWMMRAERLETCVDGKLSTHGHSDTLLLGGAMAETYAGATLVLAGMSDDMVAGGGMRVSASGDLSLAGLIGGEERIGSAHADGALLEAYSTHFEREYGNGNHVARMARFSGTMHITTATGFRPLFKVMKGVRNLTPAPSPGGGADAAADAPSGTPPPAAPPPAAPPSTGTVNLLGDTSDAANASEAAFEPFTTVPAAEDIGDIAADGTRSADTADKLDEARHLTLADVDNTLAHLRARAGLPDDAGMDEVFEFLRGLGSGQIGDDEVRRAGQIAMGELQDATVPFRELLQERGLEFQQLTLQDVRTLLANEAEIARDSGDLTTAAELEGALVGFDAVAYQTTTDFLNRFPDLEEADTLRDLPVTLPPSSPPSPDTPQASRLGAGLDPTDVALQLEDVRDNWLEDFVPLDPDLDSDLAGENIRQRNNVIQAQADLIDLALDEVRRGNDPMTALDAQVKDALLRKSNNAARFPGEADALEEAADAVRLLVNDTAAADTLGEPHVYDVLGAVGEEAASANWELSGTYEEPWDLVWRRITQADDADSARASLAAVEDAGNLQFEGASIGNTNDLTDLSTDEARRIDDSALGTSGYEIDQGQAWGDADDWSSGYETIDSWPTNSVDSDGYATIGFSPAGDYPQPPSALPRDVDAQNLRQAISDARQAVPEADQAKRHALSVAVDAVLRNKDPTAVINDAIDAAKAGRNTDPLLGVEQVDTLADVNALLNELVDQNRTATSVASGFGQADDTRRIDALRDQTDSFVRSWSAEVQPYESPMDLSRSREYFVNRPAGQTSLDVDITITRHEYEELHEYADLPIHIKDGEVDAANHTYATVRERRWANRPVHEADPFRAGPPPVLTVKDDDPFRVVGFLRAADGSDDPLNGLPLISVTQAEKLAIDDGDIAVKVIDTNTLQPYRDYRLVANRPDGIDGGVSRRLSPPDLMHAIAREHDNYFKSRATWARRQWGPMPLPPTAKFQPVSLGPDGVFRPIDLLPP